MNVESALLALGLKLLRENGHAVDMGLHGFSAADIGFFHLNALRQVQVIGDAAEAARITGLAPWSANPPCCIVIGSDVAPEPWIALAGAAGAASFTSPWPAHTTVDRLRSAFAETGAPRQNLHASLIEVLGLGVLLTGPSGSGKSELALELVGHGHRLVADDAVELTAPAPQCLLGAPPPLLLGFIEVRGLGILDLRAAYGEQAVLRRTRVDLAMRIETADTLAEPLDRLHGRRRALTLLGVTLPEIVLPGRLGHNAVMVEAACRDHWLRCGGYVACAAFADAQTRLMSGGAAP